MVWKLFNVHNIRSMCLQCVCQVGRHIVFRAMCLPSWLYFGPSRSGQLLGQQYLRSVFIFSSIFILSRRSSSITGSVCFGDIKEFTSFLVQRPHADEELDEELKLKESK